MEITEKDWKQVEGKIKQELDRRMADKFRKQHERVWKEVDRQVSMEPVELVMNQNKNDWHSAIELGELAKASEIINADVLRVIFPNVRTWMEAHVELPPQLDPNTGQNIAPGQKEQIFADGVLRALLTQQHVDFGFKARFSLSIKEALHHGSFVAEVRGEDAVKYTQDGGISSAHAPVWVPHSMWNCYPDPSPAVIGANMFYTGSMIIREFMPLYKLKEVAEGGIDQGWMPSQLKRIKKQQNKNKDVETDDVELIKYYGDCVIDKKGEPQVVLPNSKVIIANGTIVYYAPNELPFPNIIYNGYERQDVRDPYYTSPLIKLSPMHKLASTLANKTVDITALHGEPPGVYDANDPEFARNGGPVIAPARMTGTKYMGKGVQMIPIGDPTPVINALQMALEQIRSGTSVDSIRAGAGDTGDTTATEARISNARSEVRVVDFVDKLEFSLKSYLYMQHEINKREMGTYAFYNQEMDAPDFMRLSSESLPENVHFDVVGAKGVLGEEQRSQKMTAVTAFASQNPMFAPLLKAVDILKEMYLDAGVKNPERFLNVPDDELAQIEQQIDQKYQQGIQELQGQIFQLEKDLAIQKAVNGAKVAEALQKGDVQGALAQLKAELTAQVESVKTGLKIAEKQQTQPTQVSITEVGSLIENMKTMLESRDKKDEKTEEKEQKKLDAMMEAIKEMNKAMAKLSKPRKLIRDKNGNPDRVVVEE